ncbi:ATP-binding protein [Streptomyces sp. G45]|uniref:ATP-binding protein n=1 Tax=Streptomyces sp. G45 TaxID=3406627 RepID=UPI003C2A6316
MPVTLYPTTCVDRDPAADTLVPHDPPAPDDLSYSLTLPASRTSPAVARRATAAILRAHALHDMTDAAVQDMAELAACAWRFTPVEEVYACLRYRCDALRVILYDGHPRHTNPRLAAICDERRRASLNLMACVVRACVGEWGFDDAREPGGGTRMWAVLPREGARAYGSPRP